MIAQLQPLMNYNALPSFIQSAEQTKAVGYQIQSFRPTAIFLAAIVRSDF
jgi:hypothetical protein